MHAHHDEQQTAHSSSNVHRADGVGLSCLCESTSCMSRASVLVGSKLCCALNICTNVIASSGRSAASRGATLACTTIKLCQSALLWPLACSEESVARKAYPRLRANTCQKSRGGAPAPPRAPRRRRGRGPTPARPYTIFCLILGASSRVVSRTWAAVKRVFQEQAPPLLLAIQ